MRIALIIVPCVALGILLGALFTACFELLYRLWRRLRKNFTFDGTK